MTTIMLGDEYSQIMVHEVGMVCRKLGILYAF